jgi:hypothetical protein
MPHICPPNGNDDGEWVRYQDALELVQLAKEATNGWACHAKTKREHDEITRLHTSIDAKRAERTTAIEASVCPVCGDIAICEHFAAPAETIGNIARQVDLLAALKALVELDIYSIDIPVPEYNAAVAAIAKAEGRIVVCGGLSRIGAGYVACVLAHGHKGVCRG